MTSVRTSPRGDDGRCEETSPVDQLAPCVRNVYEVWRLIRLIHRFEVASFRVGENCRPGLLGFADDDHIGMGLRFVRKQGDVRPAENDRPAPSAEFVRDAINVSGIGSVTGDADEVGGNTEVDILIVFIDMNDPMRRFDERRQVRHRQLREVVKLSPPERFDVAIFGSDEEDVHLRQDRKRKAKAKIQKGEAVSRIIDHLLLRPLNVLKTLLNIDFVILHYLVPGR